MLYFFERKLISSINSFFSEMLYPPILPFSSFQEDSKLFLLLHCSSIWVDCPDVSTNFPLLNEHQYIQNTDKVVFTERYSQRVRGCY